MIAGLEQRLRAAGPPPSFDHLHGLDVNALSRLIADDEVVFEGENPPLGNGGNSPAEPRRRKRRPTLASVKRQTAKVGVEVAAYEFRPGGTIVAIVGKTSIAAIGANDDDAPDRSEWH